MSIDRRKFMHQGAWGLAALTFGDLFAKDGCIPTSTDYYGLGPYHLPQIPLRQNLVEASEPGDKLKISGKLLDSDCLTPISNALIEVWHADSKGCYSHPWSCSEGEDYYLYGALKTTATGEYSYSTILPGRYLNGTEYRPSHIHYRIVTEDNREFVTQLYFEDDPYLATDLGANDPNAKERIIPLVETTKANWEGVFHISLSAPLGIDKVPPDVRNNSKFRITSEGSQFKIYSPFLNATSKAHLKIVDLKGRILFDIDFKGNNYYLPKNTFRSGMYSAILTTKAFKAERIFNVP